MAVAGVLLVGLTVSFCWLLAYHPRPLSRWCTRAARHLPRVPADRVGEVVLELSARARDLLSAPGRLGWAALWSMGNWLFDLLALWAGLAAFGASPQLVLLTVAFCVAQIAASLPISPAGLGVVEAALVPLLVGFGTGSSVAVLGVLTWRLVNYWLPLPIGGIAYLSIVVERGRSRAGGQPAGTPAAQNRRSDESSTPRSAS